MDLKCEPFLKKESQERIVEVYKDRIDTAEKNQLFCLLHDIRFMTSRTYHADGSMTIKLGPNLSDALEKVFEK